MLFRRQVLDGLTPTARAAAGTMLDGIVNWKARHIGPLRAYAEAAATFDRLKSRWPRPSDDELKAAQDDVETLWRRVLSAEHVSVRRQ